VAALHARPTLAQPALAQPDLVVSGGPAVSFTLVDDASGMGAGGYVAAEVLSRTEEWLMGSLYAGLLLTWPDGGCGPGVAPCDISASIFFLGIKGRLMAPIPWVGPFVELGVGLSIGKLTTHNGAIVEAEAHGVIPHWQWAVGLAIGPRHQFSLSLQYLEHNRGKQSCGAIAVGYAFPLG
jgi:hypothetical protein